MVMPSLEAADRMAKEGVEVEVIDLRTLMPYDKPAIFRSIEKTNRALISAVTRRVNERAPLHMMLDERLVFHDAQQRLHGVVGQVLELHEVPMDMADAAGTMLPEHFQDF